jgi:pilus assembly protein CpaB
MVSETLLRNVRVLAIGAHLQATGNEPVMVGDTATLELSQQQVEAISLAQRTGQLSLALRSLGEDKLSTDDPAQSQAPNAMTIVRYGVQIPFFLR